MENSSAGVPAQASSCFVTPLADRGKVTPQHFRQQAGRVRRAMWCRVGWSAASACISLSASFWSKAGPTTTRMVRSASVMCVQGLQTERCGPGGVAAAGRHQNTVGHCRRCPARRWPQRPCSPCRRWRRAGRLRWPGARAAPAAIPRPDRGSPAGRRPAAASRPDTWPAAHRSAQRGIHSSLQLRDIARQAFSTLFDSCRVAHVANHQRRTRAVLAASNSVPSSLSSRHTSHPAASTAVPRAVVIYAEREDRCASGRGRRSRRWRDSAADARTRSRWTHPCATPQARRNGRGWFKNPCPDNRRPHCRD